MRKQLELYVHIPFCEKKCLYCDFLSFSAEEDLHKAYVDKLIEEIRVQAKELFGLSNKQYIYRWRYTFSYKGGIYIKYYECYI